MFSVVKSKPSWYYRVQGLLTDRYHRGETNLCDDNADPRPEDFNEDLSDCSTFSCASRNGCEHSTEDICEYHRNLDVEGRNSDKDIDKDDRDDMVYFGEMKLDRLARKRELEQMNETLREKRKKEAQKIKVYEDAEKAGDVWRQHRRALRPWKTYEELATKNDIALEMRYVNEIQGALDQAQSLEGTSTPLNLGLMKTFKLWSIDHIKHCPYQIAPSIYIDVSSRFEYGEFNREQIQTLRAEKLSGHIYLLADTVHEIDHFTPPEHCSTKTHNLGTKENPVYIQFFNDNYMTLKISRETVFRHCEEKVPWIAPSFFTY
ncbi:hypothetical protein FGLOB1_4989 [Fusarium globosum]|uniref:Uncharacterized protein n=1 Tax=Fusarium globosum TaxID=78864 RepID=A0A8H5YHJ5_9HYPO|nr:hypothetical protein FGLOB1_4989 [Fusarium globosum]